MKIDPTLARRRVLGILGAPALLPLAALPGCGEGSPAAPASAAPSPPASSPTASAPSPAADTPLGRLKAALQKPALGISPSPLTVTQSRAPVSGAPTIANALILPTPLGFTVNPNPASLADLAQLWGHRRGTWTRQRAGLIGTSESNQSWFVPISRDHVAASQGSQGVCGLHFRFDGRAFELLCAGTNPQITLIADGQYSASQVITTTLANGVVGSPMREPNAYIRLDFGSRAIRQVSLYARSSQGPCALAIDPSDTLAAWDRSSEASIGVMTDSYGGAPGPHWGVSGPFWEAAAQLGIVHMDLDAIGGSGYAPNNANEQTRNPGNAFRARLPSNVDSLPDLFITAGGINDNNSIAAPPLYASASDARAGFETAVADFYKQLRSSLPQAVLAAIGPWAPRQTVPVAAEALSKADTIRAALQAAGGAWVFLDNLNGGWSSSSGASGGQTAGPWQTGTGNAGVPSGSGNGDRFVSNDGVHPNAEGSLHLATRIATDLRSAIASL